MAANTTASFIHVGSLPALEEIAVKCMAPSHGGENCDVVLISIDADKSDQIKALRCAHPAAFLVVFQEVSGITRMEYFRSGANMVSTSLSDCESAFQRINEQILSSTRDAQGHLYTCPSCKKQKLSLKALWEHMPMYHVSEPNFSGVCTICNQMADNMQTHIHNVHPPPGCHAEPQPGQMLYAFAIVVCRRPSDGKFLVVQEFGDQGFWLPGGALDLGEDFFQGAIRETLEEAGVKVDLKGIISIEFDSSRYARMRVIFYAEPAQDSPEPKTIPDYESAGSMWLSVDEVFDPQLPLRGSEPKTFFKYVARGGVIHPLTVFQQL